MRTIMYSVLTYIFLGAFNLFIVDRINKRMSGLNDAIRPFNDRDRIVFLIVWPIPTSIFWYTFVRSFFGSK